jgi:hypothetical protein
VHYHRIRQVSSLDYCRRLAIRLICFPPIATNQCEPACDHARGTVAGSGRSIVDRKANGMRLRYKSSVALCQSLNNLLPDLLPNWAAGHNTGPHGNSRPMCFSSDYLTH